MVYLRVGKMVLLDASEGNVLTASLAHDVYVEAAQVCSYVPHFVVTLVADVASEHLNENQNYIQPFDMANTNYNTNTHKSWKILRTTLRLILLTGLFLSSLVMMM